MSTDRNEIDRRELLFFQGSNWIPADNFLTTISDNRYRAWLTLLRDGNQNMVRIWGGGIYEPDIFYNLCDGLFTPVDLFSIFQFAHRIGNTGMARLSIRLWGLPSTRSLHKNR